MPSEYIQRLIQLGAKPLDPKLEKAFQTEMQERVIPAILEAEKRQRALVHNLRVRPISVL